MLPAGLGMTKNIVILKFYYMVTPVFSIPEFPFRALYKAFRDRGKKAAIADAGSRSAEAAKQAVEHFGD